MNALANPDVGQYFNEHFVSSFQKVGTFRVENGAKQGGNVASYFCLSDGSVLHAVPGPVDAATLLREARWVIDARKLARSVSKGSYDKYQELFRTAHAERLKHDHGVNIDPEHPPQLSTREALKAQMFGKNAKRNSLNLQGQVHWLLVFEPLVKIEDVYPVVFERILGEKVSTLPVQEG